MIYDTLRKQENDVGEETKEGNAGLMYNLCEHLAEGQGFVVRNCKKILNFLVNYSGEIPQKSL